MKIVCSTTVLVAFLGGSVLGKEDVFHPTRIQYEDIMKATSSSKMMDELSRVGLISVSNMPESFRNGKKQTLAWTHPCAVESAAVKGQTAT